MYPQDDRSVGSKDDAGKWQFSLFPLDALIEVAGVLYFGAYLKPRPDGTKGYGADNWRAVEGARARYYNGMIRHATAWFAGERNDVESGRHHLAHAACCALFLIALDKS